MNNIFKKIYVVVFVVLMVIPFAGMLFFKTDTTTENKRLAELPELVTEDGVNKEYLSQLGDYFEDHFAFRQYMVDADSRIQSGIFKVSSADTVLVGESGWLYYTATLDNYLGTDGMTERELYNAARNMKLMQDYVTEHGAEFVLAIPPNKNTLYSDNMPYYDNKKANQYQDLTDLTTQITEEGINYSNLYDLLSSQSQVLYLKRDSHWNNMGALLAYNSILDKLGAEHDNYETASFVRKKDYVGDLNSMLYPISAKEEWNLYLEDAKSFNYDQGATVEDLWIETSSDEGQGCLLMFRDSFGNALLPYMATAFEKGYFSKNLPYNIAEYMSKYSPDYVVVEKVERNTSEFVTTPPVFEGAQLEASELDLEKAAEEACGELSVSEAESNINYWQLDGYIDGDCVDTESDIYVEITDSDGDRIYSAFGISTDQGDQGFRLYVAKTSLLQSDINVKVYVSGSKGLTRVLDEDVDLTKAETLN